VINRKAIQVKEQLANKGIFIRHFNKPGLEDHIRISVGRAEHTDILLNTLGLME
jgi:histidinol-phosphate aminotransferase